MHVLTVNDFENVSGHPRELTEEELKHVNGAWSACSAGRGRWGMHGGGIGGIAGAVTGAVVGSSFGGTVGAWYGGLAGSGIGSSIGSYVGGAAYDYYC